MNREPRTVWNPLRSREVGVVIGALLLWVMTTLSAPFSAADTLTVAAASDLRRAFDEMGTLFEKKTGNRVIFTYGSTGLLAKQVEQGAPFDLFAAANIKFIDDLISKGAITPTSKKLYAQGQLTIWTRKDSPVKPHRLQDLTNSRITKIAIANPEHAPYGQAAQQALQSVGIWDTIKPKLVYGENISQTLQFAQSGNADVAVMALSLSIGSNGWYVAVPGELHKPIIQAMGITTSTKLAGLAQQFEKLVISKKGHAILRKYGFEIPKKRATQ